MKEVGSSPAGWLARTPVVQGPVAYAVATAGSPPLPRQQAVVDAAPHESLCTEQQVYWWIPTLAADATRYAGPCRSRPNTAYTIGYTLGMAKTVPVREPYEPQRIAQRCCRSPRSHTRHAQWQTCRSSCSDRRVRRSRGDRGDPVRLRDARGYRGRPRRFARDETVTLEDLRAESTSDAPTASRWLALSLRGAPGASCSSSTGRSSMPYRTLSACSNATRRPDISYVDD